MGPLDGIGHLWVIYDGQKLVLHLIPGPRAEGHVEIWTAPIHEDFIVDKSDHVSVTEPTNGSLMSANMVAMPSQPTTSQAMPPLLPLVKAAAANSSAPHLPAQSYFSPCPVLASSVAPLLPHNFIFLTNSKSSFPSHTNRHWKMVPCLQEMLSQVHRKACWDPPSSAELLCRENRQAACTGCHNEAREEGGAMDPF